MGKAMSIKIQKEKLWFKKDMSDNSFCDAFLEVFGRYPITCIQTNIFDAETKQAWIAMIDDDGIMMSWNYKIIIPLNWIENKIKKWCAWDDFELYIIKTINSIQ